VFEVVPLAPTSTHSGVVDHPGIECNPAILYFSIFSLCDASILGPSQGEVSSMYKMCLSLSEKMIKSGRELKVVSPSPMCAGNGVFFFWPSPGIVRSTCSTQSSLCSNTEVRLEGAVAVFHFTLLASVFTSESD